MINSFLKSRFLKFSIVGFSGTIVDVGISNLLRFVFLIPEIPSITISFILAVLNNFHWNRVWTYPELKSQQIVPQLTKFALISIVGYIIRTPLFTLFEKQIGDFSAEILKDGFFIDTRIIGHNLTLILVIIIILFWNYLANRIWTYREMTEGDKHEVESP
jgi:putative flippase GtrA